MAEIEATLKDLYGRAPDDAEFPGGRSRKSHIYHFGDLKVVASRRKSRGRAALEAEVLRRLGDSGLVPKLIHHVDEVIVQEFVPGTRLTVRLNESRDDVVARLMQTALASLAAIHRAADRTGLTGVVPLLGADPEWIGALKNAPHALADELEIACPDYDFGDGLEADPNGGPTFTKWDARPANAMVRDDGQICWFDWEHAGRRRSIDDAAWLLGDEWSPDLGDAEASVLAYMPVVAPGGPARQAFLAFGVAHSIMRLRLIMGRYRKKGWAEQAVALKFDRIGVNPANTRVMTARAGRWAGELPGLEPLVEFFQAVDAKIASYDTVSEAAMQEAARGD